MTTTVESAVAADLISAECAVDRRSALAPFEPLIGSWDLHYTYRPAGGEPIEGTGYAHFGWGLRGTAIVDIWSFDSGFVGTTIRYYDPHVDRFRSTWISPSRNVTIPFVGRCVEGRIVLNAVLDNPSARRLRWSFVSIADDRFSWIGEACDDGVTWFRTQEIEGFRKSSHV